MSVFLYAFIPGHSSREMAVKFNDYFEFPREFDMAPYTAATLAGNEGKPCLYYTSVHDVLRFSKGLTICYM